MKNDMQSRILPVALLLFAFFTSAVFTTTAHAQAALQIGDEAPEIKLPTPQGDTVSLHSLRGRIVLVDFWASWCAPCVLEQPELAAIYKRHQNLKSGKRFEIYGISLDNKKERWLAAINKMKLTWTQVSDLKFWNSSAAKTYKVEALPYNLLVDEQGIIVAVNLHGVDLEKKVTELISPN